jgi:hypothetical protein
VTRRPIRSVDYNPELEQSLERIYIIADTPDAQPGRYGSRDLQALIAIINQVLLGLGFTSALELGLAELRHHVENESDQDRQTTSVNDRYQRFVDTGCFLEMVEELLSLVGDENKGIGEVLTACGTKGYLKKQFTALVENGPTKAADAVNEWNETSLDSFNF